MAACSETLPGNPPEAALNRGGQPASLPRKQTLLVVDDEEGPRQSIRIIFKDEYQVLMAEDGPKAIRMAKENPIDVAVLDIRMAGMSGIDVLRELKAIDPQTEVVMLTAYETLETARQALRLEAREYLNKPFDIATLRRAIRSAMERRELSLQARADNLRLRELQQEIQKQKLQEELARTRGEIYASIIHDINGPLTIISGFIELINQRVGEATRLEGDKLESVKDRLARVTRQVANCIQISNRYLSFLRGGAAGATQVSVNQVFADLEELLKTHLQAQKHTLVIRQPPEDMGVQINGTDLIQILLNLAINGFQSSDQPHRVEIRAERLSQPLDLSQFPDGQQDRIVNRENFVNTAPLVALAVQDDGSGVSAEIVGNLFEPYFTTKAAGHGTGLGLSIVKRLVEQAGGAIRLHTEVGAGSTFTVYLRASETAGS